MKNPRRVLAGQLAYAKKKRARDEANKKEMQVVSAIIFAIVLVGLLLKIG